MVPMLLSRDTDASERAHQVRVALAPGALALHYEQFVERTGIQVLDGFGSTESNFVICTPLDQPRPGWMGKVAAGFQARVVDEFDNEVPHGTPGELVLRNDEPFAFASGYFEMPEKTGEAWRNLWFHTGDRVLRDEDGYFRFLDRMKDSIRRRGENISSFEVEQVVSAQAGTAGGMHGLVEVVRQLTGRCGVRSQPNARTAIVSGYGMVEYRYGMCANAVILEATS